ncbi:hypothetical protein [Agrococcus jejuensis]|uniref:Lipoprotein n=1 Tax=Agrococcus jejuensis TaxID=399736 RepID=A0A1G8DU78_9MICO|nr:hypothetical protein [Agrococcus jejuensis]SDH61158.1 hypothetical protein SAMN04489720_1776 [Agrococcus jejuensis]
METSTLWARGAAAAVMLLALAGCSSAPEPDLSPSPSTTASPSPAPSETAEPQVDPLPESFDCRLASGIFPPMDLAWGAHALQMELVGLDGAEIAMVAPEGMHATVTPSADAVDPEALVVAAVQRIEAAGYATPTWSLAPAVPWTFDDLCASMEAAFVEMTRDGAVTELGIQGDARLRVGIRTGFPVPSSVEAIDDAHPGLLLLVETVGVDIGADGG